MRSYRYLHLDVFTAHPFEGNQLAVFPEPDGLSTETMQTITREMNFSECTFIFPAERGGDVKMRIFTPGKELPIAGHPTIGSAFALAIEGTIRHAHEQIVFELGVGPTPVTLEWDAHGLAFAWMTQPLPSFGAEIAERGQVAAALGVNGADLVEGLPVQEVSCGVSFLYVPLRSREAVDRVVADRRAAEQCCRGAGLPELPIFVFALDEDGLYSRMLAPAFGIAEDPATGSAGGPLGSYLVHHGVVRGEAARSLVNLQGAAMKRPSRIHIAIDAEGDRITRVRVGGQAVLVGRGEIFVDA